MYRKKTREITMRNNLRPWLVAGQPTSALNTVDWWIGGWNRIASRCRCGWNPRHRYGWWIFIAGICYDANEWMVPIQQCKLSAITYIVFAFLLLTCASSIYHATFYGLGLFCLQTITYLTIGREKLQDSISLDYISLCSRCRGRCIFK